MRKRVLHRYLPILSCISEDYGGMWSYGVFLCNYLISENAYVPKLSYIERTNSPINLDLNVNCKRCLKKTQKYLDKHPFVR